MALAAEMPHLAFHALMARVCDDELSVSLLRDYLRRISLSEWFDNPEHATKRIEAGQLNRLCEVALLCWMYPFCEHARQVSTRAAYVGVAWDQWKRIYETHFAWLQGEMDYLERLGTIAYHRRKFGPKREDY